MRRRAFLAILGAVPIAALLPWTRQSANPLGGWRLYISSTPTYAFGFSGFTPAAETQIVGQILYQGHLSVPAPEPYVPQDGETLWWLKP